MNTLKLASLSMLAAVGLSSSAKEIVSTPAYKWVGDSIIQGEYKAYALSDSSIVSSYSAQPHYKMPVSREWRLKNDISSYPMLSTPNRLHNAIYNMGLDEMVNAVEPDTTLRTGKEWAGVWTRDVSYSILLSMAYLQPDASRVSLMKKVTSDGRIIQDTGSGGAWPVSTDREIWTVAAFEVYKVTGDKEWLGFIYPVIKKSLEDDRKTVYDEKTGLVRGETSFIDWREQSHPKWMQTADIYNTETLSTSIVHSRAWFVLGEIASILGHADVAEDAYSQAGKIAGAVNRELWLEDKGYYGMYLYGRENLIMNPRAETLGEALALVWDVAGGDRAKTVSQCSPVTPYGAPIFFPQISDMPAYHNNALWPWVSSWWGIASAKTGNELGVMQAIGSVFRPAALFCTNKENLNLDNGDIATELNSSNMLWCLAGNLALTHKVLFGIDFQKDGLAFKPFVPEALDGTRSLSNFRYRDAVLNITVKGYGANIRSFTVNGRETEPFVSPDSKGVMDIVIEMDCQSIPAMKINETANVKAPLTPVTWLSNDPSLDGKGVPVNNLLQWNPIEYIAKYIVLRDGRRVAETRETSFAAVVPGEYQVIGVDGAGIESFASEPRSNRQRAVYGVPDESTQMLSREAMNKPGIVKGFHGGGFAELDHLSRPLSFKINVPKDGEYALSLRYANGNGPVNTKNMCAVRTILVDGYKAGTVVMPQRGDGNWDDWGMTNTVKSQMTKGSHVITVTFSPENENMNVSTNHALVDELIVEAL